MVSHFLAEDDVPWRNGILKNQTLLITLLALVIPSSGVVAEPPSELDAWFRAYAELWWQPSQADDDAVPAYYAEPFYVLADAGPLLVSDAAEHFRKRRESFRGEEPVMGDKVVYTIHSFSKNAARVAARWQRYENSGSRMQGCLEVDYQVGRFEDGWKFTSFVSRWQPKACDSGD